MICISKCICEIVFQHVDGQQIGVTAFPELLGKCFRAALTHDTVGEKLATFEDKLDIKYSIDRRGA